MCSKIQKTVHVGVCVWAVTPSSTVAFTAHRGALFEPLTLPVTGQSWKRPLHLAKTFGSPPGSQLLAKHGLGSDTER